MPRTDVVGAPPRPRSRRTITVSPLTVRPIVVRHADTGRSASVADSAVRRERTVMRQAVNVHVSTFLRSVYDWTIDIPGRHYSGLSNNNLLEVRHREGRPFDAHTTAMDAYVRTEVLTKFEGASALPTRREMGDEYRRASLEWIVARIYRRSHDIRVKLLTTRYAKQKIRDGYGGLPIGVRTGAWLADVYRARIRFTTR